MVWLIVCMLNNRSPARLLAQFTDHLLNELRVLNNFLDLMEDFFLLLWVRVAITLLFRHGNRVSYALIHIWKSDLVHYLIFIINWPHWQFKDVNSEVLTCNLLIYTDGLHNLRLFRLNHFLIGAWRFPTEIRKVLVALFAIIHWFIHIAIRTWRVVFLSEVALLGGIEERCPQIHLIRWSVRRIYKLLDEVSQALCRLSCQVEFRLIVDQARRRITFSFDVNINFLNVKWQFVKIVVVEHGHIEGRVHSNAKLV